MSGELQQGTLEAIAGGCTWGVVSNFCKMKSAFTEQILYQKISSAMEMVLAEYFQSIPSRCCWHSQLAQMLGAFTRVS